MAQYPIYENFLAKDNLFSHISVSSFPDGIYHIKAEFIYEGVDLLASSYRKIMNGSTDRRNIIDKSIYFRIHDRVRMKRFKIWVHDYNKKYNVVEVIYSDVPIISVSSSFSRKEAFFSAKIMNFKVFKRKRFLEKDHPVLPFFIQNFKKAFTRFKVLQDSFLSSSYTGSKLRRLLPRNRLDVLSKAALRFENHSELSKILKMDC